MKWLIHILLLMVPLWGCAQEGYLLLRGRVVSEGKGVPYATVQMKGTSAGVICNDEGCYELKVPCGAEADTVVVRSAGFVAAERGVRSLKRNGRVELKADTKLLQEVVVKDYRSGLDLLRAALNRIADNYQGRTTYATFFFRDWRTLNGELYLFDEAVMRMKRRGYGRHQEKYGYTFASGHPEFVSDHKTLLRHRLIVCDRALLGGELDRANGVDEMLGYADNESFFDPLYAPQASYPTATRKLQFFDFAPTATFFDNGERYSLLRAQGPGSIFGSTVTYQYIIRMSDLAIVQITTSQRAVSQPAPVKDWVNAKYNRLTFERDTSLWDYDVRDGRYTLTRYYNFKEFRLSTYRKGHEANPQRWQSCTDWTLTESSFEADTAHGHNLDAEPRTLGATFGESSFDPSFWGRYNCVLIDTLPLRLLEEKLRGLHAVVEDREAAASAADREEGATLGQVHDTTQAGSGVLLMGRVAYASSEKPAAGCKVQFLQDGTASRSVVCDPGGRFAVEQMPLGEYTVEVVAGGASFYQEGLVVEAEAFVELKVMDSIRYRTLPEVSVNGTKAGERLAKMGLLITSTHDPKLWNFRGDPESLSAPASKMDAHH